MVGEQKNQKNGFHCVPCFFLPVGFYHDLPAAVAGGVLIQIQIFFFSYLASR